MSDIYRVPWAEVRYGTEHEESDREFNENYANGLIDGDFDIWEWIIARTDADQRYEQGIAIMDDVLIAFDVLGWKLVSKDGPELYPMLRDDDFRPDWVG